MEWYTAAERFTEALAAPEPTPGGGAAAAMAGAMGCALAMMAVGTTLKRKATPEEARPRLTQSLKRLTAFKNELKGYIRQDGEAYAAYLTAKKLSKDNPAREKAVQDALLFAARVPADAASAALHCLREVEQIKGDVAEIILSDAACAKQLLQACIKCSVESIRANLAFIKNEDRVNEINKQIATLLKAC